ncbi:hypothetical protein [Zwartia sp.]|uniref:hypothetical protein n=1 Tax=Zwartia sp. TaxID=2978004 RepID=UPI00271E791B|nr:hypothetical protein [Zwartia sp.]MDO9023015.1 hypothetical protein [Zwartia sp.]
MIHATKKYQVIFWAILVGFLVWDTSVSPPVDLRNEPPLIAAGSGKPSSGGHCAIAK